MVMTDGLTPVDGLLCGKEGELFCVVPDEKINTGKNFWNRTKNLHCLAKYWIPYHRHTCSSRGPMSRDFVKQTHFE